MTPPMWVSPRTLSDLSTCRSVTKMLSCHDPSPYTVLLPEPTLWAMGGGRGRWRPAPLSWGCLMVLCMVSTGSQHSDEAGHHITRVSPGLPSCLLVFTVLCVTTAPVTDNNSNRAGVRTGYICPPGHQVDWAGLGWLLITGHRSPASCVCLSLSPVCPLFTQGCLVSLLTARPSRLTLGPGLHWLTPGPRLGARPGRPLARPDRLQLRLLPKMWVWSGHSLPSLPSHTATGDPVMSTTQVMDDADRYSYSRITPKKGLS